MSALGMYKKKRINYIASVSFKIIEYIEIGRGNRHVHGIFVI